MKTYIILFRGINVGGKNILPMKALRSLLETEGYGNVNTCIQSGNVILSTESNPLKNIKLRVQSEFGFSPEILALDKAEFEKAVGANPYPSFDGKTVHFYFCAEEPGLNVGKIQALVANDEEYKLDGRVFYLHAPNGIGRSRLVSNIESCLGTSATGRNLNTVLRIKKMLQNE